MTLCALAVVGGLVVLVTGMRRLDRSEQAWGVTLMLLAVVAATTASVGFGDVGECC
jgi:anaerobic C4-dicarboxylate transporter